MMLKYKAIDKSENTFMAHFKNTEKYGTCHPDTSQHQSMCILYIAYYKLVVNSL